MDDPTILGGLVGIAVIGVTYMVFFNGNKGSESGDKAGDKPRTQSMDLLKYPGGKLFIYFGSQTGTSEGFARVLMEEGKERGFNAEMCDLEDFDSEDMMKSKLAIFLMATYGEGEPTDNARKFYNWIKPEDKKEQCEHANIGDLNELEYGVFGLGNTQYEHYNRMGKTTNSYLERIGAKRVIEYGEGDDDGNLEEDFDNWKEKMWPSLISKYIGSDAANNMPIKGASTGNKKVSLTYKTTFLTKNEVKTIEKNGGEYRHNQIQNSTKHYFEPHSTLVNVKVNRELRDINSETSKKLNNDIDIGSTRHIELDLNGTDLVYETADNLAILPENSIESVKNLANILKYDLTQMFTIKAIHNEDNDDDMKKFKYPFPVPCSIETALKCYVDFHGIPKHSLLSHFLPYIKDIKQKSWLENILDKKNSNLFKNEITVNGKSIYSLLMTELSSCDMPLADILHILPSIQPRYYTISSSSSLHPKSVHITVSITKFHVNNNKKKSDPFIGLTSKYIENSTNGSKFRAFIRPSSFRLPKKNNTPILMIGPGTGIAPMRALLQEREYKHKNSKGNTATDAPKNTLYFGCKYSDVDYIYRDELEEYVKNTNTNLLLNTSFSREGIKGVDKIYVQHLMQDTKRSNEIIEDLDNGAYIYVCGATAMGSDVHDALVNILKNHHEKKMTESQAIAYLADLQKKGRYVQELWTA